MLYAILCVYILCAFCRWAGIIAIIYSSPPCLQCAPISVRPLAYISAAYARFEDTARDLVPILTAWGAAEGVVIAVSSGPLCLQSPPISASRCASVSAAYARFEDTALDLVQIFGCETGRGDGGR